jgi:hypothetical protein
MVLGVVHGPYFVHIVLYERQFPVLMQSDELLQHLVLRIIGHAYLMARGILQHLV